MDSKYKNDVSTEGSYIVIDVLLWYEMLIGREAVYTCAGREYMGTLLSAQFYCETKTKL